MQYNVHKRGFSVAVTCMYGKGKMLSVDRIPCPLDTMEMLSRSLGNFVMDVIADPDATQTVTIEAKGFAKRVYAVL